MGGLVGRLFREFTVTLSVAVLISLFVSLTTTPMMCAYILPRKAVVKHGWIYNMTEAGFEAILGFYRRTLAVALRHPADCGADAVFDDRAQCLAVWTDEL